MATATIPVSQDGVPPPRGGGACSLPGAVVFACHKVQVLPPLADGGSAMLGTVAFASHIAADMPALVVRGASQAVPRREAALLVT